MNGLEIVVIGIIAICSLMGYRNGFLRVVYSLFSWFVVLAIVTWTTPYLAEYLEQNTGIHAAVSEKCLLYIEEAAKDKMQEQTEEYSEMGMLGILLPKSVMEDVTGSTTNTISGILEETGVYQELANAVASYMIRGIAFFIAFIVAGILSRWIGHMLNFISHIPILHSTNKFLGAGIGVVQGVLIVWLMFYVITLCGTSEWGMKLLSYIKESELLFYLYKNNILLQIIMLFI